ncbi:MAG: hypothetical protein P4L45_15325, partial [Ignavibacteriaceae bacterium]|nr:hypothetical protein [Ignavibacteriaceae bacterium]
MQQIESQGQNQMLFNPLFIQTTGQTDASSSVLQSKLSNSSYLFSDIIKIINENTIGSITVNSEAASSSSADLTGMKTNSSNPMDQLFASSGEKLLTNNENVSLNDLIKKLLITSNLETVKGSDQTDSSTKESTSTDKTTSTLQKSDVKSLLQGLSAILSKLNISSDSLEQIISGNTNTDSADQTNIISKNLSSTSQADSSIAELVINLSKDAVSKDSSTASVSTENASDVYGIQASLLQTISTLLANSKNNSSSVSSQKTSAGSSKTDDSNQEISTEAQQLAASLFNLFQNNNNLVLNINSDSGNIKIEISKTTTDTVQTNDTGNGAVVNTKNQPDSPVNTGQQSVSV